MGLQVLFAFLLAVLAAIPVDALLWWLYRYLREAYRRLDRPEELIYFSKAPLVFFLVQITQFAKGYGFVYLAAIFFESEAAFLLCLIALMVFQRWSPLLAFRGQGRLEWVLWGVYTYMYPPLFFIAPVLYACMSLLFNSFLLGFVLTVCSMFFVMWAIPVEPVYLMSNFVLFLISFLALGEKLLLHFEGRTRFTILEAFRSR